MDSTGSSASESQFETDGDRATFHTGGVMETTAWRVTPTAPNVREHLSTR
jgi:hypothetical protein